MAKIMKPTIEGLRSEGISYKGILYAGLRIRDGSPQVLEFNCRMGDPETQPVLSRLDTDLVDIALAITDGKLAETEIRWKDDASVCVVVASGGYPGTYEKGRAITGLAEAKKVNNVMVFHAGTTFENGTVVTNGGRVLGVTSTGPTIRSAKERAYEAIKKIHFEGMHYRTDIADRALRG
jgi:phosphoribosylamine--glycine ligase